MLQYIKPTWQCRNSRRLQPRIPSSCGGLDWDMVKMSIIYPHQTNLSCFVKTLRCIANLIDDLLNENYDYILTSRFQSDPIEHHFSKYRKVSEGRFLVSLREVKISEKILLLNSIIKADLNFWEEKFRQRYVRASHSAQRNGKWNFRMLIKWRKQRSGCIESKLCGKDLFYTIGL